MRKASLCSAVLESRQSAWAPRSLRASEPLLRGFGIKAKQRGKKADVRIGASAPRFWNQGKARSPPSIRQRPSLCSAVLESRQSSFHDAPTASREPLLRGFGIKAKQAALVSQICFGASAPRFWNQGKAWLVCNSAVRRSLCSAVLESRQSYYRHTMRRLGEPLLRGFGIKAKPPPATSAGGGRASAPRFWNQGKACPPRRRGASGSLCSAVLESRQSAPSGWPS